MPISSVAGMGASYGLSNTLKKKGCGEPRTVDSYRSEMIPADAGYSIKVRVIAYEVQTSTLGHCSQMKRITRSQAMKAHDLVHHFEIRRGNIDQNKVGKRT